MNALPPEYLLLHDYSKPKRIFVVNRADGSYTIEQTGGETRAGASGFAQLRTFGGFQRRSRLIGLYFEACDLRIRMDNKVYDLSSPTLRVSLTTPLPFIRQFRLIAGDQVLFRAIYLFAGVDSWPDDGDIFTKVQSIAVHAREKQRFIAFWSAIEAASVVDLESGLERFLAKHQEAKTGRTKVTP